MSLLAVDIGSSACKAVVFTAAGRILATHSSSYIPEHPRPSFAEMNPEKFWEALCECCRGVAQQSSEPVQAFCLSSHGETFVPVDVQGKPLTAAILNQDSRAIEESAWYSRKIGRSRLFQVTGLVAHPMYPIPKMLWLRKHEPQIYASTACFVTLIGYLLQRMGLPPYVDYSLASRFLAFDIHKRCWSDEILSPLELRREQMPEPVPAGTIVGKLNGEAASSLCLSSGTLVVLGGHDQPCGALGVGILGPGRVSDSIGTYECVVACSDKPSLSDTALSASLNSYCHVVPDRFVTLAYFPSGIMVKWFHDMLFANGAKMPAQDFSGISEAEHYESLEGQCAGGPSGLCVTPHLIGTGNPEFNPHARGVIAGLGPGTTPAQIYRGIIEGLACELALITDVLERAVGTFQDIYVSGGGARSALGLRLRAALTQSRLHVMNTREAVCLGTAILAGIAAGEYRDFAQAVEQVVREESVVEPDSSLASSYQEQHDRYRLLRSAMITQVYA